MDSSYFFLSLCMYIDFFISLSSFVLTPSLSLSLSHSLSLSLSLSLSISLSRFSLSFPQALKKKIPDEEHQFTALVYQGKALLDSMDPQTDAEQFMDGKLIQLEQRWTDLVTQARRGGGEREGG